MDAKTELAPLDPFTEVLLVTPPPPAPTVSVYEVSVVSNCVPVKYPPAPPPPAPYLAPPPPPPAITKYSAVGELIPLAEQVKPNRPNIMLPNLQQPPRY
jgi:hypothetical protein